MILLDTHVLVWTMTEPQRVSHAAASAIPEDYPRDPADRLIGATARAEGLTLITRDERIRQSKLLRTIW